MPTYSDTVIYTRLQLDKPMSNELKIAITKGKIISILALWGLYSLTNWYNHFHVIFPLDRMIRLAGDASGNGPDYTCQQEF
jgi:hypothetical protein